MSLPDPIRTEYMRLALILRHRIGTGASDNAILMDAKELILASRKLAHVRHGQDQAHPLLIMRRVADVLTTYDLVPYYDGQVLTIPMRAIDYEVPT